LCTLVDADLRQGVVHKQRWRRRGTSETQHSRPPDDLESVATGEDAPIDVAVDGTRVYWANSGNGVIRAVTR
jgi:hypothetical protein